MGYRSKLGIMKFICIDNINRSDEVRNYKASLLPDGYKFTHLTIGRVYSDVDGDNDLLPKMLTYYKIIDDSGKIDYYHSSYFKHIDQHREERLESILK
jgi:hypothetical protein